MCLSFLLIFNTTNAAKNKNLNKSKEKIVKNLNRGTITTNPPSEETIENLNSIFHQLEFLNLKLEKCFENQKEYAEQTIYEKINKCIKLKEHNFNISSKLNNMNNISLIEEFFTINYPKIIAIQPKLNNILENIDDFKLNVNYSIDRIHLEDNIVYDENNFKKNLDLVSNNLEKLNLECSDKLSTVEEIKNNFNIFLNIIEEEKKEIDKLKINLDRHKTEVIGQNIKKIYECLIVENEKLELELYK